MNLWFNIHFLFAGLYLSSSAPTPEECLGLVEPLAVVNVSKMYDTMNFISGYTDHEAFRAILKVTDSSWFKVIESLSDDNRVLMTEENKIGGSCFSSTLNLTLSGGTAAGSVAAISSTFHTLASCDSCLILSINSTASNLSKFFDLLKLNSTIGDEEINVRSFYLFGTGTSVKDSDLQDFKQKANCLGFTGEPDFQYDPENSFCDEGEGVKI